MNSIRWCVAALVLVSAGGMLFVAFSPGVLPCAKSTAAATPINPADGAVRLSLWVKFGSVNDKIVLRGLALNLVKTAKKAPNKDEDDQ